MRGFQVTYEFLLQKKKKEKIGWKNIRLNDRLMIKLHISSNKGVEFEITPTLS